jgi:hypothetical protein
LKNRYHFSMARDFLSTVLLGLLLASSLATVAAAQGRRAHTRPTHEREVDAIAAREAAISLTVAPIAEQLLQTWIRTAGIIDGDRQTLRTCVTDADAALIRNGQRIRTFPPDSKSSVYQARVRSVTAGDSCVEIEAELDGQAYGDATRFVMEIIVDRGTVLAVANAAIIERDGVELVYEQIHPGHYEPHEIRTGIKGETYTQVLDGVTAGMPIVTIGSFFVDADYRLRAMPGNGMDAHQHH